MKKQLPVQELHFGKVLEEKCACGKLLSHCSCDDGCREDEGCCGGCCK